MSPKRAYVSPLRENAAARTREAILAAATDLFARRGYGLVTVAEIAAAAGVSAKTVFASVGSKRDILDLIVDTGVARSGYAEAVRQILALDAPREVLRHLARGTRTGNESQFAVHEVIHNALPVHEDSEALRERAFSDYRAVLRATAARLHVLHELHEPESPTPYSPTQTADLLWLWFGPESWRILIAENCWTWDDAEQLLYRTSVAILCPASAH